MYRSFIILLVGGLASIWTVSSQAKDAVLGQLYGRGVHSYFSSDYVQAYEQLTSAIGAGSRDPRVYYFRGLVDLQLGRAPEARTDFSKGAELESKDLNKYYNVGRALERVQGAKRQLLETYRVRARMIAFEESAKLSKARYEAIKREEARVLLEQAAAAADENQPAETIPTPAGKLSEEKTAEIETKTAEPEDMPADEKPVKEENKPAATEDPFAN